MGHRIVEIVKDLLIAALVLAIIVLGILCLPEKTVTSTPWLAAVLKPFAPVFGLSEASLSHTAVQAEPSIVSAAKPVAISLRNLAGRQSFLYDDTALDAQYEALGALLGQALDSASDGRAVERTELYQALSEPGAVFCYPAELPVSLIGAWLNVSAPEGSASRFVLCAGEQTVTLYLSGSSDAAYSTEVSSEALLTLLAPAAPDGSFFAFEGGDRFSRVDGLSLLPAAAPALPAAHSTNPCEVRFQTAMASALGFNPYGDAVYTNAAGDTTYTEPSCTLSISAQGQVSLKVGASDARFRAAGAGLDARVEAARSLLSTIAAGSAGEARLYLTGCDVLGEMTVCRFGYYLHGVPVLTGGDAAVVRLRGSDITEATVLLRSYACTQEQPVLLPPAQAAAILPSGQPLRLVYADSHGDVAANWEL